MVVGDSKPKQKVIMKVDEDEQQEYVTLLLEGYSEEEAKKLSKSANNTTNSNRLSGPIIGGKRPFLSDMSGDEWSTITSFTQDNRTKAEKEIIKNNNSVTELLNHCTPKQKEVLVLLYGIDSGVPMSPAAVIKQLGLTSSVLFGRRKKGLDAILRGINKKETELTIKQKEEKEEKRKIAKREYTRIWMANKRKQQKLETEVNNDRI